MSHQNLKYIKENLMRSIEGQMCNIYEADAEELGCAIDMLKDLEEALYYCTITEAMEGNGKHQGGNEYEFEFNNSRSSREMEPHHNRMYYDGRSSNGRSYMEYYDEYPMMYNMPRMYDDGMMYNNGGSSSYGSSGGGSRGGASNGRSSSSSSNFSEPMMMRDYREGRSPENRRMYMEAKEMKHDKAVQMRELEKYMQELSQDITEMIGDASTEEKQFLEKKLVTLASKINQMK